MEIGNDRGHILAIPREEFPLRDFFCSTTRLGANGIGAMASLARKALGVLGLYMPPPLNRSLAKWRGVRLKDPRSTWIGVRTLIDNEYPELVSIGANVTISFDVVIVAHVEPPATMQKRFFKQYQAPIDIGSNVFIGARAIILPGVTVQDWSVIAAGSVVTRDVPEFAIVAGNPARQIGDVREKQPPESQ